MSTLSPFVYWAQNEASIFLKIDLKDVQEHDITLEPGFINFYGSGTGAQGFKEYSFKLLFFEAIDANEQKVKISDNCINVTLTKMKPAWWPRLIFVPQKPSWLKIDFDKWQSEDDMLDEKVNNIEDDFPDVYKDLMKNELGYIKEDFKAVYLLFYNLGMLSAFLYASVVVTLTLAKNGLDQTTYEKLYPVVGHVFCFIQLLQALEIMHALFGYVNGSPLLPLMQIGGRLFVLFGNLEFEPRLQKMPATTWLFMVWAYSDVIRYVYYLFHTSNSKNAIRRYVYPFLRWLRYSAWIILYPVGFVCEAVIVFRNLLYLHTNPKWYLRLPNPYNMTFDYLTFLQFYMTFVMLPGMYVLLRYMYKARVKHLGGREPFEKFAFGKRKLK